VNSIAKQPLADLLSQRPIAVILPPNRRQK
jgi:hypothetical protein